MSPFIGNIVASRWAFEASMVTQFKENAYESEFYEWNKQIGQTIYMKTYYIPTLESKLAIAMDDDRPSKEKAEALSLLRNEIGNQLRFIKSDIFPEYKLLTPESFDDEIGQKTKTFLTLFRKVQNNRFNKINAEKNEKIAKLNATEELKTEYLRRQILHRNESIEEIVTGKNRLTRIQEVNGKLIQKYNLIYKDPNPLSTFDFRQQFYIPSKNFFGITVDTFWYNLMIIWFFSIFFTITLYYDLLKRIIIFCSP